MMGAGMTCRDAIALLLDHLESTLQPAALEQLPEKMRRRLRAFLLERLGPG
jgi:hypothetical protein